MTQPNPDPGRKSILQFDLLDLPGLRAFRGSGGQVWDNARGLGLSNHTLRREAKALLFAELAEAARQGVPLDTAAALAAGLDVDMIVATGEELTIKRVAQMDIMPVFIVLAFILAPFVMIPAYLILSGRFSDPTATARAMARRLHGKLARGIALADAMSLCGIDFENEEIELVRNAEKWGNVPAALSNLAEYQIVHSQVAQQSGRLSYPILLAVVGLSITAFCYSLIIPKFVDIYRQLGAELPWATQLTMDLFDLSLKRLLPLIFLVLFPALLILILRGLFNGTIIGYVLAAPLVVAIAAWLGRVFAGLVLFTNPAWNLTPSQERSIGAAAAAACAIAAIVLLPRVMSGADVLLGRIERLLRTMFRWFPALGAVTRAQAESLWLASLATALQGGSTAHEAVAAAGRACGTRLEARSAKAAALVEGGKPIGAACRAAGVLSAKSNSRLEFLDRSPDLVGGLLEISRDASFAAGETSERSGRFTEVAGTVLVAIAFGWIAFSIYMPLFTISRAVISLNSR